MTIISAMMMITKYSLPTINFATRYSTRYSGFLLQPYSNPTRSQKNLLVCAWWWDMCYICFIYFLYLMSVNCSAEMKRIMTREDLSTPLAHGDSTIGVFVCLPLLESSRDASSTLAGWKLKGGIIPHVVCFLWSHLPWRDSLHSRTEQTPDLHSNHGWHMAQSSSRPPYSFQTFSGLGPTDLQRFEVKAFMCLGEMEGQSEPFWHVSWSRLFMLLGLHVAWVTRAGW